MTTARPCAVIVGRRYADGGRPCAHAIDEHERHQDGAFVYFVCRPCRNAGVVWATDLGNRIAGADHWYADGDSGRRASLVSKEAGDETTRRR